MSGLLRGLRNRQIVILAVLVFLGLTSISVSATERVTLTLLWRESGTEEKLFKDLIQEFERRYPNITVKLVLAPGSEYDTKLTLMYASGLPVDIFSSVGVAGASTYILQGQVRPIDDLVKRDKVDLSAFVRSAIDGCSLEGKLYGLPLGVIPSLMVYNADLFEEVGALPPPLRWDSKEWTWDDMVKAAKKLTLDKNGDGKLDLFGVRMSLWPASVHAWLWGGDWFEDDAYKTGVAKRCTADTPAVIKSLEALRDLAYQHHVSPRAGEGADFAQGTLAMSAEGGWVMRNMKELDPPFRWSIALLPKVESRQNVLFTDPLFISSWSKHPEEAWEFIKFVVSNEGQTLFQIGKTALAQKGGYTGISALRTLTGLAAERFGMIPRDRIFYTLFGAFDYAKESPNHMIHGWNLIQPIVDEAFNAAVSGQKPASISLKEAEARLNPLLAKLSGAVMK